MQFKDFIWRVFNSIQQSPLFPSRLRTSILRVVRVQLDRSARIAENVFIASNKLIMGKETYVNVGAFLDGNAPIVIECY